MSLSTIYIKYKRQYKQELKKLASFIYIHVHTWDIFCFIQKISIFASIFVISTIWKSIKKKRGKKDGGRETIFKTKKLITNWVGILYYVFKF